jgi:hypothetical protein
LIFSAPSGVLPPTPKACFILDDPDKRPGEYDGLSENNASKEVHAGIESGN